MLHLRLIMKLSACFAGGPGYAIVASFGRDPKRRGARSRERLCNYTRTGPTSRLLAPARSAQLSRA